MRPVLIHPALDWVHVKILSHWCIKGFIGQRVNNTTQQPWWFLSLTTVVGFCSTFQLEEPAVLKDQWMSSVLFEYRVILALRSGVLY